jgi:F0F1-type ATP synthase assembly protein I
MNRLMKHSLPHTPTHHARRREFTASNLLLDFADTTWRIAVPVVLFSLVGIFADRHFGSEPWLTLLGSLVGFALAAYLVKLQLDASRANEEDDV